jgi:glycine oxidase
LDQSSSSSTAGTRRVAVVGAGIIGASIAWRLAQRGWNVVVYDRGDFGGEASWAGAGMLAPGGEVDEASELLALAKQSRSLYGQFVGDLEAASGQAIDYQENGALDLAYSADEWHELKDRAARQMQLGIASKAMSAERVKAFWPFVRAEGLAGAMFYPNDAVVDPRHVMAALRVVCERAGVTIAERRPVDRIGQVSTRQVRIWSGTEGVDFRAAVLAAGAWSGSIATVGLSAIPASEPVKGHLIAYKLPQNCCQTILRHGRTHTYIFQRSNGLLIAGSNMEYAGFDRSIQSHIVKQLESNASFVLPHLAETAPTDVWTGFRPGSDALHIGRWQASPLYLAYGHLRNGLLLAPATAARIADEMAEAFY